MRSIDAYRPGVVQPHSKLLVVFGESGVGKSFLTWEAMRSGFMAEEMGFVNLGDVIPDIASGYTPITKDKINNSPSNKVDLWLGYSLGFVAGRAQSEERPYVVTAHLHYDQNGRVESAAEHYQTLRPAGIIFVAADSDQIHEWRRQDTLRERPAQTPRQISRRQRASFRAAEELALDTGARLITIWNRPDNVSENVARIRHEALELFI